MSDDQPEGGMVELGATGSVVQAPDDSGRFPDAGSPAVVADSGTPGAVSTTSLVTPATVFVQVAGEVRRPGVYEVPAGSRVFEVLARAGGVTPSADEEALPLAAQVSDGARIIVADRGASVVSGQPAGGLSTGIVGYAPTSGRQSSGQGEGGAGAAGPLSLASATEEQLDALPGIGPSLARQIVVYREAHGPFGSVAELEDVPGIGPATVAKLEGLVVP